MNALFHFFWSDRQQCLKCIVFYIFVGSFLRGFLSTWGNAKSLEGEFTIYWIVHGMTQWAAWGICITIGASVAIFMKDKPWWLKTHMLLQSCASIATIPAIMTAWLTTKPDVIHAYTHVSHASVGLIIAVLA